MSDDTLPTGLQLTRTTPTFDEHTVPAGLLATHRIADAVWGRLVVHSGSILFRFEDTADDPRLVDTDEHVVIPPARPHRLQLIGPVTFTVEFHRRPPRSARAVG